MLTGGIIQFVFLTIKTTPPQEEIHIDPSVHEVGSWMYLHRYAHHLYQYFEPVHENSKNMLTSPMVLNLGVSVAKLARKQVCFMSVPCLSVSRFVLLSQSVLVVFNPGP